MLRRPVARVGRRGVIGTVATTAVVAGTATAVSGHVRNKQEAKAQQAAEAQASEQQQAMQAQQAAAAPPPPAPAPAGGMSEEAIAQLQQLAALKDQGILSEEEFAAQKAKILGS